MATISFTHQDLPPIPALPRAQDPARKDLRPPAEPGAEVLAVGLPGTTGLACGATKSGDRRRIAKHSAPHSCAG